jgi:hypothetical protein
VSKGFGGMGNKGLSRGGRGSHIAMTYDVIPERHEPLQPACLLGNQADWCDEEGCRGVEEDSLGVVHTYVLWSCEVKREWTLKFGKEKWGGDGNVSERRQLWELVGLGLSLNRKGVEFEGVLEIRGLIFFSIFSSVFVV